MSKKNRIKPINENALRRRIAWEVARAEIAEGRRQRAATFIDRKRESNRRACRGRVVAD